MSTVSTQAPPARRLGTRPDDAEPDRSASGSPSRGADVSGAVERSEGRFSGSERDLADGVATRVRERLALELRHREAEAAEQGGKRGPQRPRVAVLDLGRDPVAGPRRAE